MKKISLALLLILAATISFGKSYQEILQKINSFLEDFDNGYYGHLEIKNGQLWDYYKNGNNSHMQISDYKSATIAEINRKVTITCNTGTSCVTGYDGGTYDNMPFSQSTDFDAYALKADLDDLIDAYRSGSSSSFSSNDGVDFSAGTKVRILEANDNTEYIGRIGTVENSALRPMSPGWYMGTINFSGTNITFRKMKVEKVK